jgi:hypothetical protein
MSTPEKPRDGFAHEPEELGCTEHDECSDRAEEIRLARIPETPVVERPQLAVALPTGFHWRSLPRTKNFSSWSLKQERQRFRK